MPEPLKRGLVIPVMSSLHKQASSLPFEGGDIEQRVAILLGEKQCEGAKRFLDGVGLLDAEGKLGSVGSTLLTHRVIGSYGRLTNSYTPLITHLAKAASRPEECGFGRKFSRNQEENAIASNQLIANIITRLQGRVQQEGDTLLDLGSGGGFFAEGLGLKTILFDISETANNHAVHTFRQASKEACVEAAITGDITNKTDLEKASRYTPDAVTINYIIHDILGQAPNYAEGLETVKKFLGDYKELFGKTPLFITESWDVSWDDLRAGGKSYISLYTWLHAISPQRLISKDNFLGVLDEVGFHVAETIVHGALPRDGKQVPINETLVVYSNG